MPSNKYFVKLKEEDEEDEPLNKVLLKTEYVNERERVVDGGDVNDEDNEEEEKECLFCFDEVNIENSFIGCNTCGKLCHDSCYFDWFKRKNSCLCISCQQPTLVYSKTNVTIMSVCLHSIFGSKKKYYKKFYNLK